MKEIEIWADIRNYEGLYQVSNLGRVRTHKDKVTYTERHGYRKWKQRILKYKNDDDRVGYRVDLWKNGKPRTFLVARLVAFTFYSEDYNNRKLTVNHKDGNRMNNQLNNLELLTLEENIYHAFETGLYNSCKRIKVTNKYTNEVIQLNSMAKASKYLGHNAGYISGKMKSGINENSVYKWELV